MRRDFELPIVVDTLSIEKVAHAVPVKFTYNILQFYVLLIIHMWALFRCVAPIIIINYLFDNIKFLPELYAKLLTQSNLFYHTRCSVVQIY